MYIRYLYKQLFFNKQFLMFFISIDVLNIQKRKKQAGKEVLVFGNRYGIIPFLRGKGGAYQ